MTGVEPVPVSTTKPVGNTCAPALAASASRTAGVSGRSAGAMRGRRGQGRSEEHTSELQSLMRISYAVFCLKQKHHIHPLATQLRLVIIIDRTQTTPHQHTIALPHIVRY